MFNFDKRNQRYFRKKKECKPAQFQRKKSAARKRLFCNVCRKFTIMPQTIARHTLDSQTHSRLLAVLFHTNGVMGIYQLDVTASLANLMQSSTHGEGSPSMIQYLLTILLHYMAEPRNHT